MRGALADVRDKVSIYGIIPAYAGSTQSFQRIAVFVRDHPRVCGEHPGSCEKNVPMAGSSPRMRGAPLGGHNLVHRSRIIPAYAGSTAASPATSPAARDHPRVCGEHVPSFRCSGRASGSSPRMRGALRNSLLEVVGSGIIPAYAGSTRTCLARQSATRDHPRVCGEHPPQRMLPSDGPRIIPAYAGSTIA